MRRLVLFLLMSGGLLACRKAAGPNQNLTLVYRQPTTTAANGAVQATLTAVNDSRCPSGAQCI